MAQIELIVGFISILAVLLSSVYKITRKITSLEKNLEDARTSLEARIDGVKTGLEARIDGVKTGLEARAEGLGSEVERLREASIASTSYLVSFLGYEGALSEAGVRVARGAIESFFKVALTSQVTKEEFEFLKKTALKDLEELSLDDVERAMGIAKRLALERGRDAWEVFFYLSAVKGVLLRKMKLCGRREG